MTLEEATDVLGFPPGYAPSDSEIAKAWKAKAREHHPDLGGDPQAMVEVNVAKEVLEGKRVNDRTEVGAEKKQRRIDLAAIESAKARATSVLRGAVKDIAGLAFDAGRVDLREYLADDFAETVDKIHDVAEAAIRKTTGKRQRRMQDVVQLSKTLLVQASRANAKLRTLGKATTAAARSVSVERVTDICNDFEKYKDVYGVLDKASGRLNELLAYKISEDDEDDIVPQRHVDAFQDCRQMVLAFRDMYKHSRDCDLGGMSIEVEEAVQDVLNILSRRRASTAALPRWDQWDADTFDHALTLLDRRTNASRRVASRYLARA